MRSRWGFETALSVVCVVAALAFGHPAAGSNGGCHPAGSRTILTSRSARVYARYAPQAYGTGAFACLYTAGRPVLLGWWKRYPGDTVERIKLAGAYVAFDELRLDTQGDGHDDVQAIDLRSGRTVHLGTVLNEPDDCVIRLVAALKLTRGGSIAWTIERWNTSDCNGQPSTVEGQVWVADSTRRGRLVASDPALDPRSLRLHRHRISWRVGPATETAAIR